MKDFEVPPEQMTLEQAQAAFEHVCRNLDASQREALKSLEYINEPSMGHRIYRRIIFLESGVRPAEAPGGMIHHPT